MQRQAVTLFTGILLLLQCGMKLHINAQVTENACQVWQHLCSPKWSTWCEA